jgi:hypothetical protein
MPRWSLVLAILAAACSSSTTFRTASGPPPGGAATPIGYLRRGAPVMVPAGTQAGYLLDPNTETCLLIYAGQPYGEGGVVRSPGSQRAVNVPVAAPVDCATLAANLQGSAVLIPWVSAPSAPTAAR